MKRCSTLQVWMLLLLAFHTSCVKEEDVASQPDILDTEFVNALYIPPQIPASALNLRCGIQQSAGLQPFKNGLSYNAGPIGPTIVSWQNEVANIQISNELREETNIHWHGILAPPDADGHPENTIQPGQTTRFQFPLNQSASTSWYHPHVHSKTGKQLSMGMAGLWLHRDAQEVVLNLPSGASELPIIIQDKRIDAAGNILYAPTPAEIATGHFGQTITVNGIQAPVHEVSTKWYRLRVVNASTARIYNLALNNGEPFWVIGNDGGFLSSPKKTYAMLLSPGERADILVNFTDTKAGSSVYLVNNPFQAGVQGKQFFKIMRFHVNKTEQDDFTLPATLSTDIPPNPASAVITRNFDIGISHDAGGHDAHSVHGATSTSVGHTINGKLFDMSRIDEEVLAGAKEIWEFDNSKGDEAHPMHIHGSHFWILSRSGGRNSIQTFEGGWKDTALCLPGEKVRVLVEFNTVPGKYVFHCHNIEHGDDGMMLNLMIRR